MIWHRVKRRNSLQKSLRPVVRCPYLCSSEHCGGARKSKPRGSSRDRAAARGPSLASSPNPKPQMPLWSKALSVIGGRQAASLATIIIIIIIIIISCCLLLLLAISIIIDIIILLCVLSLLSLSLLWSKAPTVSQHACTRAVRIVSQHYY